MTISFYGATSLCNKFVAWSIAPFQSPLNHSKLEMFYLNSTLNFGIPPVLVFQLEVYYKVERLLTGLNAQPKGTTAWWYSNKTSLGACIYSLNYNLKSLVFKLSLRWIFLFLWMITYLTSWISKPLVIDNSSTYLSQVGKFIQILDLQSFFQSIVVSTGVNMRPSMIRAFFNKTYS